MLSNNVALEFNLLFVFLLSPGGFSPASNDFPAPALQKKQEFLNSSFNWSGSGEASHCGYTTENSYLLITFSGVTIMSSSA